MIATYSIPSRVNRALSDLQCSTEAFVGIIRNLGLRISSGQMSGILRGKRPLDGETGTRLLEVLQRMQELQISIAPIPVAWSRSELVTNALTLRLVSDAASEIGSEHRQEFAKLADQAAQQIS